MEGALVFRLFLVATGTWLVIQGVQAWRDDRRKSDDADEMADEDSDSLGIVSVVIPLVIGIAAVILGLSMFVD
ncbi:hypothetical protein A6F68_02809 [Tsuneonella dongtanensis]|uniref:Uncharacterized protein n=1 Tax=Tsuneonella dongtanensis TaxID=692370 RepID=A0A1B2AGR0_9SPHN|nr:hypothetical protein [Tsuneonella dongtanensis]ANY21298.1 hypothetical protein A6F68_02809 [Tsuneonella dongtanensis]